LGTRNRISRDLGGFIADWDSVLTKLDENVSILENRLSPQYRTGIRTKDIFDNIQIFYPTDNPVTSYVDLTGANPIWWSLQHSADLLINLIRFGITRGIYFRGGISMGHVREYRNGYFSKYMIENAEISKGFEMIGARVGLSSLRVLNNKSYQSSPRFYHFVKYDVSNKTPAEDLILLNLMQRSSIFQNVEDSQIMDVVKKEIGNNSEAVQKKWKNTLNFIQYIHAIDNENLYL
jgi:hypothetical protein